MSPARILPSFQKGLRIWEYIAAHPSGVRLADLAEVAGMPSSNLSLYMNTLLGEDLVIRDPLSRRFFVHPKVVELLAGTGESLMHRLLPAAENPMRILHREYNENVLLGVQKSDRITVVKYISTRHVMRIGVEPNRDFILHVTAMGRAILAFLPDKEIERYIRQATFVKLTDRTVTGAKKLRALLEQIRATGYAWNPGEFEREVMAVAVPVLLDNRPVAALAVQFPALRHSPEEAESSAGKIMEQARAIEAELLRTASRE
jgi:DNA-binding IclR family transcriptional regulator